MENMSKAKEMSVAEEREMNKVLSMIPAMSQRVLEGQWKSRKVDEQPKWYRDALSKEMHKRGLLKDAPEKKGKKPEKGEGDAPQSGESAQ